MIKPQMLKKACNALSILLKFSVAIFSKIKQSCAIYQMYYFWLHLISEFERCKE